MAEILDRRVTAIAFEIAHEGRAIDRRKHRGLAANLAIASRIARMPGEF
jgi:hypothetical protein